MTLKNLCCHYRKVLIIGWSSPQGEEEAEAITKEEQAAPTMEEEEDESMTGRAVPPGFFYYERALFEPNFSSLFFSMEVRAALKLPHSKN